MHVRNKIGLYCENRKEKIADKVAH